MFTPEPGHSPGQAASQGGHCGGGEASVDGPGVLTRPTPAPEVILTLKLPLPLLLRHDSVVVAVVVKDLLA